MSRKRFFLLEETCPEDEIASMMGRVVVDYLLPLKSYAPVERKGERRHSPEDIIPDILPKPSVTMNRTDFLGQLTDNSMRIALTEYFGFNAARSPRKSIELESHAVYRYSLRQADECFQQLMKDELYARDIGNLLTKSAKGYLVVGFLATKAAKWKFSAGVGREVGVNFKVPISSATGGPPQLDPSISLSRRRENKNEHSYQAEGMEVFAVAYDVVSFKHSFDSTARHYVRKNVEHGPPKRVRASHLALGGEDSNSEDEVEEEAKKGQQEGILSVDTSMIVDEEKIFGEKSGSQVPCLDM